MTPTAVWWRWLALLPLVALAAGTDHHNSPEQVSVVLLSPSARERSRRSPLEENPDESDDHGILSDGGGGGAGGGSFARGDPEWRSRDELFKNFDISDNKINETLKDHWDNITTEEEHKYYASSPVDYSSVWVDLDELNSSDSGVLVREHPMLSKSYRRAATIALNFSFPFYGHEVNNITIATGGFLYTGQYVHSWLAATQYIAPLMANFDTSQDHRAKIRYADNGTALIVEWVNVHLQDDSSHGPKDKKVPESDPATPVPTTTTTTTQRSTEAAQLLHKEFTFQAILHKTGDIVFAYKSVPVIINTIQDAEHPVKVGLSDAYIIDRTIFFVRRKTIYEYHRVSLKDAEISSNTAIYFKALSTCNRKRSCNQCLSQEDSKKLKCKWCPRLQQCSDGLDRNRQRWLNHGCDKRNADSVEQCGAPMRPEGGPGDDDYHQYGNQEYTHDGGRQTDSQKAGQELGSSVHMGLVTILFVLFLLVAMAVWLCYAYFFPHTWSGQVLIKYRPTRWHWLRSEPRYTAASIHM